LKTPSDIFGFHIPPFSWFDWLSHKTQWRLQLPWGLVTQIVVVGIVLFLTLAPNFGFDQILANTR
ncbi:MAG: hypothetical protein U1C56_02600, partial [Candidatus Curtissbacteria bacterium]|nr:hypothetical protein [Candidatus Curtissbacteria bacterium]